MPKSSLVAQSQFLVSNLFILTSTKAIVTASCFSSARPEISGLGHVKDGGFFPLILLKIKGCIKLDRLAGMVECKIHRRFLKLSGR
jgi:hypothetical protein